MYRETKLIQFEPCRAKKKLIVDEVTAVHAGYFVDQKLDGERYVVHTDRDPDPGFRHGITSRRLSQVTGNMVEKTDRVPHISNHPQLPRLSMIDCEFVASGDYAFKDLPGKFWDRLHLPGHPHSEFVKRKWGGALPVLPHVANTVSILGSLGPEAVRKQEERGLVHAWVFDIVQYDGRSLVNNTQSQRRNFLAKQFETVDPELGVILMPTWVNLTVDEIVEFFYLLTDNPDGGEGLVLKDPTQKYNAARNWYKLKVDYGVDVVYTGESKIGKGDKVRGMAASLEIGVYRDGVLEPIGWISAIRDGVANLQTPEEHRRTWTGVPVEVRHNGLQKDDTAPLGYTLRHPRFRRLRPDKNASDCTWQALYEESSKTK